MLALVLAMALPLSSRPASAPGFRGVLLEENNRLKRESLQLASALGGLGGHGVNMMLVEMGMDAPTIKCEEFMTGALKQCRDAHVECVKRAFESTSEKLTARSIRRAALDAKSMDELRDEEKKNIQPQDMTPLQRRQNFAKENGVATMPFAELKLSDHIKPAENITEIERDGDAESGSGGFSNERLSTATKTLESQERTDRNLAFRGQGSVRQMPGPTKPALTNTRNHQDAAQITQHLPSLDAPTPEVLARQEKLQKGLDEKLSKERYEELKAEQGEQGAFTNAMQTLQNAMRGQQTQFDRNGDSRLKEEAQDVAASLGESGGTIEEPFDEPDSSLP